VLLEQKKIDECEKICKDLLEKRYDMNTALKGGASFEKVAKVYNRLASCYAKQDKFDDAILMYEKSLAEDNTRQTRAALNDLKKAKIKAEKDAYINPELAEEHKTKGNDFFKEQKWAEAKKEYDEAIKRNPADAKLYANRAAALTKLMAHPDALRDLEESVKLDPKYVKAWGRKGATHFFMKDYNKALQAYDEGLKLDPNDETCKQGKATVAYQIQKGMSGPADEKQVQEAMKDPEIQKILRDPQVNIVLKQLQEEPHKSQDAIQKDPQIAEAINKLIGAGIIRTG